MHRPAPTPTTAVEVVAVYLGEKANTRRDQWAVHTLEVVSSSVDCFRVGMEIEATGNSTPCEIGDTTPPDLRKGCEYLFDGKIEVRKYRGQDQTQLKFANFTRVEPLTKQGVLRYLEELDVIGNKMAGAIFAEFGLEAVKVLRETPERTTGIRLRNGKRLSLDQANAASKQLRERQGLEHTTIQLMGLLNGYGLPKSTARKAIHKWGVRAAERIRRNPLGELMSFRGCGFLKADKVYQSLDYPLDALKRMTLCAWHCLSSDANGHTWLPRAKVMNELRLKVGGIPSFPQAKLDRHRDKSKTPADWAVDIGIRAGLLAEYTDDAGGKWLAEGEKAREEERLSATILSAMDEPNPWEAVLNHPLRDEYLAPLSDHQREKLFIALRGGSIAILGGGPGTGKTFTAACLIRLLIAIYGEGAICGTAFTGKASTRLTEGMAAYGITLQAKTTHSLLKVKNFSDDKEDDDGERSEFEYNAENPLPFMVINADEWSMNGVPLALALLLARARGCAVLIIGDIFQLLPIDHGAPLRDFIYAGLPYGELTEIRRNAGQVVRLCKKLREGTRLSITDFCRFEHLQPDAADPVNCALVPASSPQAVHDEVVRTMKGARDRFGYDPIWDMQVIVATNKQRVELNAILQREFNPTADTDGNAKFRVGDKIIALQNAAYPLVDSLLEEMPDSAVKVANGEFARIVAIQDRKIIAKFTTPNRTVALRKPVSNKTTDADGKEATTDKPGESEPRIPFDLGYAATCHKMQGSQAKFVVVALDKNTFNTSCEWFMTADSRPEKAVVNVGEFSVITRMAGNKEIGKRKTFLRERIEAGRLWGERVWWGKEIQTETVTT